MTPIETALRVTLPYAAPYVLTGVKFAIAYSLIGHHRLGVHHVLGRHGLRDLLRLQ